jgi:saccharopine dehydrogenase-like NADP-dependent oxidoreductase
MAIDLAADDRFEVTVVDVDPDALQAVAARADIRPAQRDLSAPDEVADVVREADLVLSAVPSSMGYRTLENVIRAGRDVVDIAFFAEDPFSLDDLARAQGVTAVVDCGVFPGMGSALIGRVADEVDAVDRVLVYVGGLPETPTEPWAYKAVFSPIDVIEEYTRPARFVENGVAVTRPALSDAEVIEFPGVGPLEAFNTDGLRTLLTTIDAPDMQEKTLRHPGHIAKMAALRDSGFFSTDPVDVDGQAVRPLDLTTRLLFPMWKLQPGERDLTVLRVLVEGRRDGRDTRYSYDLLDRFDVDSNTTSMARTTGYTATMTARLIADGRYDRVGISPPEYLGRVPGAVAYLLDGLARRGVRYEERIDELDEPS